MTKYIYKALKDNKDVVEGDIEALTPRDARANIRELGFVRLNILEPEVKTFSLSDFADNRGSIKFLSLSEKIMFVSELQVMLASGISVVEALSTIQQHSPKMKTIRLAKELQDSIISGKTFAESLNYLYHDVFGQTFIDLCATGENSGELDTTLERLLVMLRKQDNIKGNIIQALFYPCILILFMFGLLVVFARWVFPAITAFLVDNQAEVPPFSAMVIGALNFVKDFWWLCFIGIFAAIGLIIFLSRNENTRGFIDGLLVKIPVIEEFVNYINLSNYMCILSISYASGVPFVQTLNFATRTIGNKVIRQRANQVNLYIEKGATLSNAFANSCLLPGALVTMVAAGEKSGNLQKMLDDCIDVIDKKIDMVLQTLTKAVEPVMIVVLGVGVLIIAIAFIQMYLAMIQSIAMI